MVFPGGYGSRRPVTRQALRTGYAAMPWKPWRASLAESRTLTPRRSPRLMRWNESVPWRTSVGSPCSSDARTSDSTRFPSCVTSTPRATSSRASFPESRIVPSFAGAFPAGRITRFPLSDPTPFSPGSSQKSPTTVSQPSSAFSLSMRRDRHLSISARWASSETFTAVAGARVDARKASRRTRASARRALDGEELLGALQVRARGLGGVLDGERLAERFGGPGEVAAAEPHDAEVVPERAGVRGRLERVQEDLLRVREPARFHVNEGEAGRRFLVARLGGKRRREGRARLVQLLLLHAQVADRRPEARRRRPEARGFRELAFRFFRHGLAAVGAPQVLAIGRFLRAGLHGLGEVRHGLIDFARAIEQDAQLVSHGRRARFHLERPAVREPRAALVARREESAGESRRGGDVARVELERAGVVTRRGAPLLLALRDPPETELRAGAPGVEGERRRELALGVRFVARRDRDLREETVRLRVSRVEVGGSPGVRHRAGQVAESERLVGGVDQRQDVDHRLDGRRRAGRRASAGGRGGGVGSWRRGRHPDLGFHGLRETREVGAVQVALAVGGRFRGVRDARVLLRRLPEAAGVESLLRLGLELRGFLRNPGRRDEEEPEDERERAPDVRHPSPPHCSIPCSTATGAGGVHGASPRSGIVICWVAG